jgi:membrane protease subunit HflC
MAGWALALLVVAAVLLGPSMLYTVSEREQVVVLQFGEVVASRRTPGLYVKLPLVQEVRRLPRTLQFWDGSGPADLLTDVPTADGFKIEVSVWALWRIVDPEHFVQTLRTVPNAELRVKDFVRSATRNVVTAHDLGELVRSTDRPLVDAFARDVRLGLDQNEPQQPPRAPPVRLGRAKLVQQIRQEVQRELSGTRKAREESKGRGIELVDVGISRIDFVPDVREQAFNKQIAFMESLAARYVNEGELRKREILNRTNAEVQKIEGEGAREAAILRGRVDAEITSKYAQAISQVGEFYNFTRTLEAYESVLGGRTRLVLTTESPLLRLLTAGPEAIGVQGAGTGEASGAAARGRSARSDEGASEAGEAAAP